MLGNWKLLDDDTSYTTVGTKVNIALPNNSVIRVLNALIHYANTNLTCSSRIEIGGRMKICTSTFSATGNQSGTATAQGALYKAGSSETFNYIIDTIAGTVNCHVSAAWTEMLE